MIGHVPPGNGEKTLARERHAVNHSEHVKEKTLPTDVALAFMRHRDTRAEPVTGRINPILIRHQPRVTMKSIAGN